MKTEHASKPTNSSGHGWIFVVVIIIGWVLLRAYAQSGVDSYDRCYWQAVSSTNAAKNATIAAGYSSSDATIASFDMYADQVNNCSKHRPPDWVILMTGVTAKDSN
jgi:hypothetical protein